MFSDRSKSPAIDLSARSNEHASRNLINSSEIANSGSFVFRELDAEGPRKLAGMAEVGPRLDSKSWQDGGVRSISIIYGAREAG